jgi:AI-2 transport protein TqsA
MGDRKTTNILLLLLVVPVIFYLLKVLSFIFIPLVSSMFIALLFLPLMRWLSRRSIPKLISIVLVFIIVSGIVGAGVFVLKMASKEIRAAEESYLQKAEHKLLDIAYSAEKVLDMKLIEDGKVFSSFVKKDSVFATIGPTFDFVARTLSISLMTLFFVVLLLSESINMQHVLNSTIMHQKFSSIKTFMKIEKDLITFIKVKVFVSLFTGIFVGIACWYFGVSFPIFWGLFAFIVNFVQMIGSIICVALLAIFSIVELDAAGTWLGFVMAVTGVQVLWGSVLEPVFMGKSFSINIVTILVMLLLWGFIWGIPGMIMAIPITVFAKILLEQFPNTQVIAEIMQGAQPRIRIPLKKAIRKTSTEIAGND